MPTPARSRYTAVIFVSFGGPVSLSLPLTSSVPPLPKSAPEPSPKMNTLAPTSGFRKPLKVLSVVPLHATSSTPPGIRL